MSESGVSIGSCPDHTPEGRDGLVNEPNPNYLYGFQTPILV